MAPTVPPVSGRPVRVPAVRTDPTPPEGAPADALADQARRLEERKAELGAATVADKEHLSVEQLQELAREQEIPGRSSMDREQLMATVAPG